MKKGSIEFIPARNANLRREFFRLRGEKRCRVKALFNLLAKVPADRFYVSEERAYRLLLEKRRTGRFPHGMWPTKRRMLEIIDERVSSLVSEHPDQPLYELVFRVVNSPAPSFFLTPNSIRTILYKEI